MGSHNMYYEKKIKELTDFKNPLAPAFSEFKKIIFQRDSIVNVESIKIIHNVHRKETVNIFSNKINNNNYILKTLKSKLLKAFSKTPNFLF